MKTHPFTPTAQELAALLDSRLTQIRRPVEPQPRHALIKHEVDGKWYEPNYRREPVIASGGIRGPLGEVGDEVWVKEKFALEHPAGCGNPKHVIYWASVEPLVRDCIALCWQAAPTMPRWASRINRRVTDVRVERLQGMTEDDAAACGITRRPGMYILDYAARWDTTYARQGYAWASNPLVWIYETEHNQ